MYIHPLHNILKREMEQYTWKSVHESLQDEQGRRQGRQRKWERTRERTVEDELNTERSWIVSLRVTSSIAQPYRYFYQCNVYPSCNNHLVHSSIHQFISLACNFHSAYYYIPCKRERWIGTFFTCTPIHKHTHMHILTYSMIMIVSYILFGKNEKKHAFRIQPI